MIVDETNRPKKPYVHLDYPCWLNYHQNKDPKLVQNAEEEAAAVELGWSRTPLLPAEAEDKSEESTKAPAKPKAETKKK